MAWLLHFTGERAKSELLRLGRPETSAAAAMSHAIVYLAGFTLGWTKDDHAHVVLDYSPDADEALQFARRADAEKLAASCGVAGLTPTEHAPPAPPLEAPRG
jgi:hypothetical protein